MDISIVIPCYNSASWMQELCDRINNVMHNTTYSWELILVNDESNDIDLTWLSIISAAKEIKNILGINLQRNAGQFNATLCGMENAKGNIVVIMDDDLQHLPEDIPVLLSAMEDDNLDCVMGNFDSKNHSLFRNFGSLFVRKSYQLFHGLKNDIHMSSFRALRRPVVNMMLNHKTANPVIGSILIKSSRNIKNVKIRHEKRPYGKSGYSLKRLIKASLDNIFLATTLPLRIFTYVGIIAFLLSTVGTIFYTGRYFLNDTSIPGFTTIVILILILISINSFGLGLLGEYLDRIIDEVDGRPRWEIREVIGREDILERLDQ